MPVKTLIASLFNPTASVNGNGQISVFRGENLVLRAGAGGNPYFEVFGGNKNLNENYDLTAFDITGTISYSAATDIVTGISSNFKQELHIGQVIQSQSGEVFSVAEVVDDTHFLSYRTPQTTGANQAAYRLPQLFEIKRKRGVMLTGNAFELDKGHLIAVGSGQLYINGQPLNAPLVAQNTPQVALYRPTTNDYIIKPLGFSSTPPKPIVNVVTGGTKAMTDKNKHSFMVAYWSGAPDGTDGYSNPCEVIKLDGANQPIRINGANNRFEFDFTASLAGLPSNAKGFIIFGSLGGKATTTVSGATTTTVSPNETLYENGTWFKVAKVRIAELVSNKYLLEYLDSDVFEEVTGNNDAPPRCEFVCKMEGKPLYISAYGKSTAVSPGGSNPGAYCVPSKFANPDAAPAEWAASVSADIIGFFEGVGRVFLMTQSSLEFVVSTGLLGSSYQNGAALEIPIISRPYWRTGAANRYSIILVDDTLYGFSGNKMFRSVGNGDENAQKYDFGGIVEDITRKFNAGFVYVVQDSKNNQICVVHSASHKNAQGFWCSTILPFSLNSNAWLPQIVLSKSDRDMIVSGVATVGERFEFLAGGRKQNGAFETRTYRFDDGFGGEGVTYYLVWQISDDGAENVSKEIKMFCPTGKFTAMNVQIHGARPGGDIVVSDMERGANSLSGDIGFEDSNEIKRYFERRVRFRNLAKYAIRLSGVWSGAGTKDRLDEVAVEIDTHGKER